MCINNDTDWWIGTQSTKAYEQHSEQEREHHQHPQTSIDSDSVVLDWSLRFCMSLSYWWAEGTGPETTLLVEEL